MLEVLNGYKDGWIGAGKVYIGRQNKALKLAQSSLSNPYSINTVGSREKAISKFKEYLDKLIVEAESGKKLHQIRELARLIICYKNGEDFSLVCYCKPQACHGDILVKYIERYAKEWDDEFLAELAAPPTV